MKFHLACLCILSMARACCATDAISSDQEPCEASVDTIETPEYHEVTATQVELLQVHVKRMKTTTPPAPPNFDTDTHEGTSGGNHRYLLESARGLFPMFWLHVPKCGSTLFNSLIRLPGACNLPHKLCGESITPETDVAGLAFANFGDTELRDCVLLAFTDKYFTEKYCPGSFAKYDAIRAGFFHSGIGDIYDSVVQGHGIIMLRQPEQRIASAYYDKFHSWPKKYFGRPPDNMKEYAQIVSGCAVRMLTRSGTHVCGSPEPATDREGQIAVDRIRAGFVFVGITEEWSMSVCLLHMLFGGECVASEFVNSHPGANASSDLYDVAELDGFLDVHDGLLYDKAKLVFRENLNKFGATPSTCEPCFQQSSSASSF